MLRKQVKFLAVFVDQHLSWSERVRQSITKVASALYALDSSRSLMCENKYIKGLHRGLFILPFSPCFDTL